MGTGLMYRWLQSDLGYLGRVDVQVVAVRLGVPGQGARDTRSVYSTQCKTCDAKRKSSNSGERTWGR